MAPPTVNLTFGPGSPLKSLINNEFVESEGGKVFDVINPTTGEKIADVSEASPKDVDRAVAAAQKAYDTVWGLNCSGAERGRLMIKLAEAVEANIDEIAAIESADNGKAFSVAKGFDLTEFAACLRYYGGWADKNHGKVIEVDATRMIHTRHEPIGVVGQIIPWNFPAMMMGWKIGPALACGNTVVLKTAEQTPLSALKIATLIKDIFPPGVVNVVTGLGKITGAAIASHMEIHKVAFTGSTLVGRSIMKAAADSNLKKVTLELGGKSPNIVCDDADIEQAVSWSAFGLFFNHGQCCCAGSRVYVQESIYHKFMAAFQKKVEELKVGDPFKADTFQGPQVSQLQFDRIMAYIDDGKKSGAKVTTGGKRLGDKGYFIEPTIFENALPDTKIVQEEIFGPVVVVTKFKDDADIIKVANNSVYGLAAAVFSRDISRAMDLGHKLHAGTVWINCYNKLHVNVPFGGFKQSGIGRELGEYALAEYSNVKAVNININVPAPL
ncbi:MAG: aldehyde dehydrogenase (NAD(P)(+)) ald5 [Cyphobasidiales sp. Tagirdzhanova-0007]|nr:MAG: aldehyde dehydrogenase (NAD(P)(+)) ald5 [Cyphobasidiales sp. Tagirdzhanova-0007]